MVARAQTPLPNKIIGCLMGGAMMWAGLPSQGGAQVVAPGGYQELTIPAGKSQVLSLPEPLTDVMVADPTIADVLPLNNQSVYIVGKKIGSTVVTVYGPKRRLIAVENVVVSADIDAFKQRLHEILPSEPGVQARQANQSIVLSGTVGSPAVLQQVLALAESFAPTKVVNMVSVAGTQQVMLSVRFVEMERSTAKALRLNAQASGEGDRQYKLTLGDDLLNPLGALLDTFGQGALQYNWSHSNLGFMFDALEQKGVVKTLAEPSLVALSGDTASFLAGGEFPIPVAQSQNSSGSALNATITVEFKQFGVSLAFTPTILQDGLINLVVSPEVSSIDPSTSVVTQGLRIPGIKVRRARTTVELRDGESFTIAGLLKDDYQSNIRQLPFAGDLPILGTLFRSTGYQRDQTELVIIVTPHLVTPRKAKIATPADFVPPSDFELFLFGAMRGEEQKVGPEGRALMARDPTKMGLEGPYGHVVY
jgi:pilus assembly protein CpaC